MSGKGGPVLCVAVDPVDAQVMHAGTWTGLFRSTDQGASWSLVDLPFPDPVFSLSWDPQGSKLFAGGAGRIFVSERSGSAWETLQLPADGAPPVSAFVVHPDSASLFFAGTRGRGAFRSDDGGVSWTAMELREDFARSNPGASEVTDMAFDTNSGDVFVATLGGLFRGRTTLTRADAYAFSALVFRPQDSRLYAATASWIGSWGPTPSIYGGTTLGSREEKETGTKPYYTSDLSLDPHDPSVLWAGGRTGLYRGRFNADQATGQQTIAWSKVSGVEGPISSIVSSPAQVGLTVAGELRTLWISTDTGTSWHHSSAGMRAHRFLNVVPVRASPATLFGLGYSFLFNEEQWVQVFRSTDSGQTWTLSLETPILGRPYLAIDERPDGTVTVYLNGRLASTDLGETWTTDVPFDGPERASSLYIDPGNNDLQAASVVYVKFYSGVVPLFGYLTRVTTDGWTQDRRELNDYASSLMRTDPHSPGSLYFLGPAGIYRWDGHAEKPSVIAPDAFPDDLEPDRFISGRLYSVSGRKLYVFPTPDSQPQASSLPVQLGILTVRSDVKSPGVVAAGTTDGLYLSRDSGITWEKVEVRNAALGQVSAIFFDLSDASVLYLGTSRGAFRLEVVITRWERRPRKSRSPRRGKGDNSVTLPRTV